LFIKDEEFDLNSLDFAHLLENMSEFLHFKEFEMMEDVFY